MSPDRLELRRTLTQADFDRFAALSGDDNPIHVDPAFAARTKFGRTVSHGILLVSILRGLAEKLAAGSGLSRHEVRFPAPTFADEPVMFRVWRNGDVIAFACIREQDGAVTCDGRFAPLPLEAGLSHMTGVAPERAESRWPSTPFPLDGGRVGDGGVGEAYPARQGRGCVALGAEATAIPPEAARQHPHPNPSPIEGEGLVVGNSAHVSRTLDEADLQAYLALVGEWPRDGEVPDPLISALFSYLLGVKLPGPGANYLKQETDFLSAARVGEALTARVEVTRLRPEKSLVDLATTCHGADGRLIATGRALLLVGDVA